MTTLSSLYIDTRAQLQHSSTSLYSPLPTHCPPRQQLQVQGLDQGSDTVQSSAHVQH